MENVTAGTRIEDTEGFKGTVRYVGPVAAAKNKSETWLGVEWDDKSRGKHDGSCVDNDGILHRYFTCQHGAGSFVKLSKVSSGKPLMQALHERYVAMDAPEIVGPDSVLPGAFVTTAKGQQKQIEFVGERKIRKWQQLSTINKVAIRNASISSIGEGIERDAGHLVEIDLQDNLLWQWSEIFLLTSKLPLVSVLLLQGNSMEPLVPTVIDPAPSGCLANLRVLALNGCQLSSWSSIQLLEPLLNSIEELYLSNNCLVDLPRDEEEKARLAATNEVMEAGVGGYSVSGFPRLRVLDIANCGLDEWSQVLAFAGLPRLEQLILDENPIPRIAELSVGDFPELTRVSLSSTRISTWSDVDALDRFPKLFNLRLSHIPLFSGKGASEMRPLVIGRLSQLQVFNASVVSVRERRDSERTYLRSILRRLKELENTSLPPPPPLGSTATSSSSLWRDQLTQEHPRFDELEAIHGADIQIGKQSDYENSGVIAAELITLSFHYINFHEGGGSTVEPITKRLPCSLTVSRLQILVKQLFGLEPHLQLLSVRLTGDVIPAILDDEQATLSYYGAQDGAQIFINEKD